MVNNKKKEKLKLFIFLRQVNVKLSVVYYL